MITWDETVRLSRIVLRWWWVILLAVALSGGTAILISLVGTRYYVARATLMIGNTIESQRPEPTQLQVGSALGRFYRELARRERILRPVQEQLNLPFSWEVIAERMLGTVVVENANLLEISITDSNPVRAAAIANAIGDQLIAYSPTSPDKIAAEQMTIEQQLRESETRLNNLRARIEETTLRRQQVVSASDLAEINTTLTQLELSVAAEQSMYSNLLAYKNSSVVNVLLPFERAEPPAQPLPSNRLLTAFFAGLGGLLLALGAVFLLDRIDGRLYAPRDLRDRLGLNVLGAVPGGSPIHLSGDDAANARITAIRTIQTNVMLAAGDADVHTLLITSPNVNEHRTVVAVDLANLYARSGHRVLLVDADPADAALTRLLNKEPATERPWTRLAAGDAAELPRIIQPTPISGVTLLPVVPTTAGQPAMLGSRRWQEIVAMLSGAADMVILDGPATLGGPDAALLAPHVDAVILLADPAVDSRTQIAECKALLTQQPETRLLGGIMVLEATSATAGAPSAAETPERYVPLATAGDSDDADAASTPATTGAARNGSMRRRRTQEMNDTGAAITGSEGSVTG